MARRSPSARPSLEPAPKRSPYLGFRLGYANVSSDDALLLGGSVGLELLRTKFAILDVQTRVYALLGTARGTHVLLEPALALNSAY